MIGLAGGAVLGALGLLVISTASAAEYGVSPTGSDTATGLAGAPWKTIQRAFKSVKAGDVVIVEDGTYAGIACDGVSGTAAAPIVLRARTKWGAKITSATSGSAQDFVQLSSCSYVTLDGFEVSGAPRSGIAILGVKEDGSDARGVIIQNCYSHDNGGTQVSGRHDGIFSGFAMDLTIQDNRIEKTGEHGIYVSNAADNPSILRNVVSNTGNNCIQINADLSTGGDGLITNWRIEGNVVQQCKGSAGFNLDGAVHGVARNNVIVNVAGAGITLFQGDGAEASHDNVVVNNTIYSPSGSRPGIQVADGANNNVIFNNIIVARSSALEVQKVTGLMHDYNLISTYSGATASAHEATPPAAASLFMDAANGDYRLASGASAAIDKGVASFGGASAPTFDVSGAPRPAGAAVDIGAYEVGATTTGPGGASGTGGASGATGGSPGATGGAAATGGRTGGRGNTGGGSGSGGAVSTGGSTPTGGATATGGTKGGTGGANGATGGSSGKTGGATGTTGGTGTQSGATGGKTSDAGIVAVMDADGGGCSFAAGADDARVAWPFVISLAALLGRRGRKRD